jgi:hypothetical protein
LGFDYDHDWNAGTRTQALYNLVCPPQSPPPPHTLKKFEATSELEVEAAGNVGRQIGSLMIACKQAELINA